MRTFVYEAIDGSGASVHGSHAVRDTHELGAALRRRGLTLVRLHRGRSLLASARRTRPLPTADLAALSHYVAITARAGLPVVEGLEDFGRGHAAPRVRQLIGRVVAAVRAGSTLSDAFEAQQGAVDASFLGMLRASEAAGTLDTAMSGLAAQLRFQMDVRGQIKQALVKPAILLSAVAGLIVLVLVFLIPRILGLLTSTGAALPAPTRLLLDASELLRSHALLLLAALALGAAGLRFLRAQPRGRLLLEGLLERVPGVSGVHRMGAQARFVSSLVSLLDAGVDAVSAVRLSAPITGSARLERDLLTAAERVSNGSTLTEALEPVSQLDPLVRSMLQLGERSGALTETLPTAVDWFASELPRRVRQALGLLEPAIILGSGALVAFVLLSVMLPIFSLYDSIG